MIRIFVITMLATIGISSCDASKEVDPLFYKISEADSTWCMDEIVSEILEEATKRQKVAEDMITRSIHHHYYPREIFTIQVNSIDNVLVNRCIDTCDVVESVFEYFMYNRNVTNAEMIKRSVDPSLEGFSCPFYNNFERKEIEKKIQEASLELVQVKRIIDDDPSLVRYSESKVEEWRLRLRALDIIRRKSLEEISAQAKIHFLYQKSSPKSKEVLNQIAFAFYQMRNFECLKYFNEMYLSLYDRAQRKKRKIDLDKLEALKVLHPASIFSANINDKRAWQGVTPIPQ